MSSMIAEREVKFGSERGHCAIRLTEADGCELWIDGSRIVGLGEGLVSETLGAGMSSELIDRAHRGPGGPD